MLMGKRWKATLKTFVFSTLLLIAIYAAVFDIKTWIFIIPILLLAERRAEGWVWAAVPRPARRRLRRIWSDASRTISTGQQIQTAEEE
jgi:predicted PurR-regulated permease PerM